MQKTEDLFGAVLAGLQGRVTSSIRIRNGTPKFSGLWPTADISMAKRTVIGKTTR
jgi:hypothetical protein